jgi:hypothetical protein
MTLQMDLNIIAKNLNDDCLSYIYSFVNTRQICFKMLKQKHDTILTNHILRPTIKRFTEGKYYTTTSWLGCFVFRVEKITKCFITITYNDEFIVDGVLFPLSKRKLKRRYDKNDYEYFESEEHPIIRYNDTHTKYLVELDKLPIFCCSLWKGFKWSGREDFGIIHKWRTQKMVDDLMTNINEVKGDFDWLLIDLRGKKINELFIERAREFQEAETRGIILTESTYCKELATLMSLNDIASKRN